MSWLFSQALVEEYSEASSSDGEQSAPSNGSHTQLAYLPPDRMTAFSRLSRFGMTYKPLTESRGAELLTSYLEDFRVRTSATQGTKPELKAGAAVYGEKWRASFARFDPDTSSWKTWQHCLIEEWEPFLQTWPRSGLMRDGMCWECPTAGVRNHANECGSWPTLKASDSEQYSKNIEYFMRRAKVALDLPVKVGLTTPPTPQGFYGRLNPAWCEWLMGWPTGWTALKPLATANLQEWQQQHGDSSQEDN